jgi:antitoxin (DNA-binding transcriptional repressor) of toxin-antitoxin stability system
MEEMTIEQVREAPEKLEPFIADGTTVRITKDGKPFFDAVPTSQPQRFDEFARRVKELWADSNISRTTPELVAAVRESRE